ARSQRNARILRGACTAPPGNRGSFGGPSPSLLNPQLSCPPPPGPDGADGTTERPLRSLRRRRDSSARRPDHASPPSVTAVPRRLPPEPDPGERVQPADRKAPDRPPKPAMPAVAPDRVLMVPLKDLVQLVAPDELPAGTPGVAALEEEMHHGLALGRPVGARGLGRLWLHGQPTRSMVPPPPRLARPSYAPDLLDHLGPAHGAARPDADVDHADGPQCVVESPADRADRVIPRRGLDGRNYTRALRGLHCDGPHGHALPLSIV